MVDVHPVDHHAEAVADQQQVAGLVQRLGDRRRVGGQADQRVLALGVADRRDADGLLGPAARDGRRLMHAHWRLSIGYQASSARPQPPPVGVSMTIASPGSTEIWSQPASSSRAAFRPAHEIAPGLAVPAPLHAERRDLAVAREDGAIHRLEEADDAPHPVARRPFAAAARALAGSRTPPARQDSAARGSRGRSGANSSCGCGPRRSPSKPGPAGEPEQIVS